MRRWTLALLLIAAACAPKDSARSRDAASAAQTGGISPAELVSYKLSMAKVDQFFAAQRNMALKMKDMSPAQREAVSLSGSGSMDEMATQIESSPDWAAAVRQAGLEPREFVMLTMSLIQSSMAASVLKMQPNDDPDSLVTSMNATMGNVKFVQEHEAEISAMRQ